VTISTLHKTIILIFDNTHSGFPQVDKKKIQGLSMTYSSVTRTYLQNVGHLRHF